MLIIRNELTLQKKLPNINVNHGFWTKNKNARTTKQKSKHKNPCRQQELKPGPFAPQSGALSIGHQVS